MNIDTPAWNLWKQKALAADILNAARERGAQLKRAGSEWTGPCPACGGSDRFSINTRKKVFNCRGANGGDVIAMVQHIDGCTFMEAVERLSGEAPPSGESKPLTPEEKEKQERIRRRIERRRYQEHQQDERKAQVRERGALEILAESSPPAGTAAETYLKKRGLVNLPDELINMIRFHPMVRYDLDHRKAFPALVAPVQNVDGETVAAWRIYLTASGAKAAVKKPKLGIGPAAGGAVRFGGLAPKIGIAEGIETALAVSCINGHRFPVWAALSTAGMTHIRLPIEVQSVVIFPDGDLPAKKKDGEWVPTDFGPGLVAARNLKQRLQRIGVDCAINEPPFGSDFLDVWNEIQSAGVE